MIARARVLWPRTIEGRKAEFCRRLRGMTIAGVFRRGKYIGVAGEDGAFFTIHLRMTGKLLQEVDAAGKNHVRVEFRFTDGSSLHFVDARKFGRLIHGCPCHSIENAAGIIREQGITVGIIAVPDKEAQFVSDVFVEAGIRGILNFARTALQVPAGVYVEDIDLAMSMDRVAYFARQSLKSEKAALQKPASETANKEIKE